MDLKCLATKENADEGIWEKVVIMGQEWPLEVKVYGSDSDAVQIYNRERIRRNASNTKFDPKKDAEKYISSLFENLDDSVENAAVRIGGFRSLDDSPVLWNGKELKDDKDGYVEILRNVPALAEFVLNVSNKRSNFLSDRKKD